MALVISSQDASYNTNTNIYHDDGSVERLSHYESVYLTHEQEVDESELFGVEVLFDITKSMDENLVSGWASVSVQANGAPPFDWQDDVIRPEVLEKAAIQFMMDYRESGAMHQGEAKGIVVESIVLTKAKQAAMGIPEDTVPEGWFITVKVLDDEVFSLVKAGTYKMFSIQGSAKRVEL